MSSVCISVHISVHALNWWTIYLSSSCLQGRLLLLCFYASVVHFLQPATESEPAAGPPCVAQSNSLSPRFSGVSLPGYLEYACIQSRHHWVWFSLLLLLWWIRKIGRQNKGHILVGWPWENAVAVEFVFKIEILMAFSDYLLYNIVCKGFLHCSLKILVVTRSYSPFPHLFFSFVHSDAKETVGEQQPSCLAQDSGRFVMWSRNGVWLDGLMLFIITT